MSKIYLFIFIFIFFTSFSLPLVCCLAPLLWRIVHPATALRITWPDRHSRYMFNYKNAKCIKSLTCTSLPYSASAFRFCALIPVKYLNCYSTELCDAEGENEWAESFSYTVFFFVLQRVLFMWTMKCFFSCHLFLCATVFFLVEFFSLPVDSVCVCASVSIFRDFRS